MQEMEALTELKSDIEELESILTHVTRSNVRQIIVKEITTLKTKADTLRLKNNESKVTAETQDKASTKPSLYTTKLSNYAFDESPKFVKLYVTIKDAGKLTQEQITCEFTETSFKFVAHNHLGKNHMLQVLKLAYNIKPKDSSCKVKAGNVIISLRKAEDSKTWGHITEAERKEKEAKDAKFDTKEDMSDPSSGIMNMMKKMYDDGDDDMKRMIKKTWYETQNKQGGAGGMPGMPSMPGMPNM